ncbi:L-alanine-DL-glutamate epimerase-like enolase superfamily enzyme [Shinella sp. BE166]|uniref:hypothetical protein n=1 Tax=Shinella sp. BE166 TaxID=3373918 RepID=UPI003EBAC7B1
MDPRNALRGEVEHFLPEKDIYNFELLVTPETRQVYKDEQLILTDRAGWGFQFDRAVLDEFTVEHFTSSRHISKLIS